MISFPNDVELWFNSHADDFLKRIGVRKGHFILDFGCRVGNYAIPASKVVGPTGRIYALDKDHNSIDELVNRAEILGLAQNIVPMKTKGKLAIPLPDESVDIVLFFDVLHGLLKIDGTLEPFSQFLKEVQRVTKKGGTFSIFVKHLDETGFSIESIVSMIQSFFSFERQFESRLLHWDSLDEGLIHMFRK